LKKVRRWQSEWLRAPYLLEEAIPLKAIHPELTLAAVRCATCGSTFALRSTRGDMAVDVCSNCHQAYTGVARPTLGGSRSERFERRRRLADTQITRK
jgi:large subunit ribosomal protein L31